jgi:hypothetical protein
VPSRVPRPPKNKQSLKNPRRKYNRDGALKPTDLSMPRFPRLGTVH